MEDYSTWFVFKLQFHDLNITDPYIATRQHLNFLRLPIDISNRLFNALYLPILMYGSEVWSIYDKDDYDSWENDMMEKTQIQFCKEVLGVN